MSNIKLPFLPGNMAVLKREEDRIITASIVAANADPAMSSHINLILASLNALQWAHTRSEGHLSETETALSGLNIRMFNSMASSFNLLLCGYYSAAIACMRDFMEAAFLLDFLEANRDDMLIKWMDAPDAPDFHPAAVRVWLDARNSNNDIQRGLRYRQLCGYGAHGSCDGMTLLNADAQQMSIGPFLNEALFAHLLHDLARHLPYAILSGWKFETGQSAEDFKQKSLFLAESWTWWVTHPNPEFDDTEIEAIRQMVEALDQTYRQSMIAATL